MHSYSNVLWTSFNILLVPLLINDLNKTFDKRSFYICVRVMISFYKNYQRSSWHIIKEILGDLGARTPSLVLRLHNTTSHLAGPLMSGFSSHQIYFIWWPTLIFIHSFQIFIMYLYYRFSVLGNMGKCPFWKIQLLSNYRAMKSHFTVFYQFLKKKFNGSLSVCREFYTHIRNTASKRQMLF